ncbi:MAG: IS200/IS605 family accessory protein TnpB-related protein, partial [Sulfurihydrogenibium azorense]|uniref:IS200/IS605 family accessory protein TnpB-related protein n=1 Tax=Sulfurihydrogenibium azorense TaxID=309806 RepID=UPI003918D2F9
NELLSVVSENPELKSFIVSGKEIKAFNQWFNKEMSKLRAEIDNLKNSIKKGFIENQVATKKIYELELKMKSLSSHRKRWLDNNFHKITRKLVDLLYETGHKTIYIGKNAIESKNGIDLGKKTNQEFVSIPFRRLIELIEYKAYEYGMEVIEVDESYTSKTSPLANIFEVKET